MIQILDLFLVQTLPPMTFYISSIKHTPYQPVFVFFLKKIYHTLTETSHKKEPKIRENSRSEQIKILTSTSACDKWLPNCTIHCKRAKMSEKVVISTSDGQIRGIKKISKFLGTKFYSFFGIPYGKPPSGTLRFKVIINCKRSTSMGTSSSSTVIITWLARTGPGESQTLEGYIWRH